MSTAILSLSENGELQRIHERWLSSERACGFHGSEDGSEQLQLESFWGLFLICGIASSLALLIYFVLILLRFTRNFPENDGPSSSGHLQHSARIQTFLNFVNEKEDLAQRKLKRKRRDI
ncbi:glutamate receptor 3.2-like [Senna tora]|uniref:Glutamate receptor 3.2-like n=1 Tax=Senna tora TaxID=362788 RepID=A0A834XAH1_9FABA|nr:glutamate receptor 3.2-like [Senna tora]